MRVRVAVLGCLLAALAISACGEEEGGGSKVKGNTLTIYSSYPLQGSSSSQTKAIVNGTKLALGQARYRAGKFKLKFVSLDDSLASTGAADPGQGAANARKAVQDKTAIAFLGSYNSGIAKVEIPITNKKPIVQISPANTYVGLTSSAPGHEPGEPDKYYPTGKRNYARIVPIDTVQAAALARAMNEDGCKSVHVLNSKTTYSAGLSRNLESAVRSAGMKLEGNDAYDENAPNFRSLAATVKADCVVQTGEIEHNGVQPVKDVAAADPGAKFYGSDGLCLSAVASPKTGLPASIASRYKCTVATLGISAFGPCPSCPFVKSYQRTYHTGKKLPDPYAIYGYESTSLLLDAIKRAGDKGNDRKAVIDEVFHTRNRKSVLGTYSINKNGDTTLTNYGLYHIKNGELTFLKALRGLKPAG